MKANRKYSNSDQTCTRIKIDFTINSNHITSTIIILINREKEINKSSVIKELRMNLFNLILRKSNIKALELEDEMNLPLHIPFPPLRMDKKQEN